jgi:hypothetical protein
MITEPRGEAIMYTYIELLLTVSIIINANHLIRTWFIIMTDGTEPIKR